MDITLYYETKIQAMQEFKSQFDVMKGLINFVEGLAKARGFYCGGTYGKAFSDQILFRLPNCKKIINIARIMIQLFY